MALCDLVSLVLRFNECLKPILNSSYKMLKNVFHFLVLSLPIITVPSQHLKFLSTVLLKHIYIYIIFIKCFYIKYNTLWPVKIIYLYLCLCLCVYLYTCVCRGQKRVCDPLEWEFQADVSSMVCVLETELHRPKTETLKHLSSLCDHF